MLLILAYVGLVEWRFTQIKAQLNGAKFDAQKKQNQLDVDALTDDDLKRCLDADVGAASAKPDSKT